jgi:hypothetical protein
MANATWFCVCVEKMKLTFLKCDHVSHGSQALQPPLSANKQMENLKLASIRLHT